MPIKYDKIYYFDVPIVVRTGKTDKSKLWYLNFNNYRNSHPLLLSKVKNIFNAAVAGLNLPEIPFDPPYEISFLLFRQKFPKIDISNILSIVDKFTCDALIEAGIIGGDDSCIIPRVNYMIGEYYNPEDKDKSHCRVVIMKFNPTLYMKIIDTSSHNYNKKRTKRV